MKLFLMMLIDAIYDIHSERRFDDATSLAKML